MRKNLYIRFLFGLDDAAAASIISAIGSTAASAGSTAASAALNRANRKWQEKKVWAREDKLRQEEREYNEKEAAANRAYNEEMYQKYSSPSAMVSQAQAAGVSPSTVMGRNSTGPTIAASSTTPMESGSTPSGADVYGANSIPETIRGVVRDSLETSILASQAKKEEVAADMAASEANLKLSGMELANQLTSQNIVNAKATENLINAQTRSENLRGELLEIDRDNHQQEYDLKFAQYQAEIDKTLQEIDNLVAEKNLTQEQINTLKVNQRLMRAQTLSEYALVKLRQTMTKSEYQDFVRKGIENGILQQTKDSQIKIIQSNATIAAFNADPDRLNKRWRNEKQDHTMDMIKGSVGIVKDLVDTGVNVYNAAKGRDFTITHKHVDANGRSIDSRRASNAYNRSSPHRSQSAYYRYSHHLD